MPAKILTKPSATKKPESKDLRPDNATRILGPGVVKRTKSDQDAKTAASDQISYTPSQQVFRRRG